MASSYADKQRIQAAQYQAAYHWDARKPVEHHRYEQMTQMLVGEITGRMREPAVRVLDFGCGDGRSTYGVWSALRQAGHACRVIGVDVSHEAIEWARERTREAADETLEFSTGKVEDGLARLEAADGQPFVVMREVIEHLPEEDIDHAFQAIATRLPSVTLVVSVPSSNSPVEEKHFRHYDAESLRATFERNPFACEPVAGFGFRPRALYRPLRKLKSRLNRTRGLWRGFNWLWRPVRPSLAMTLVATGTPRRG